MRKAFLLFITCFIAFYLIRMNIAVPEADSRTYPPAPDEAPREDAAPQEQLVTIDGVIKRGETFYDIFKRYGLDIGELYQIDRSSKDVYNLSRLSLGRAYSITHDLEKSVRSLTYCIDGDSVLNITHDGDAYCAEKAPVPYDKRTGEIGGVIKDNLVSSLDDLLLALDLSDIFAWDIDFTSDLREGDTFSIVVEELWLDGEFDRYGKIISAEFNNNGKTYNAYRYVINGKADYFDGEGKSLRRAFLKAPLSYRRISSGFSKRRLHPILRIYRPHLGVDYAAPVGTPVSSVGDGTVAFAGYKAQNGRMVVIRHPAGYKTYYGHLSRIARGVRKGKKVRQGQVIGAVGRTGLSTGPHLDYRIKRNGKFINPLRLRLPSSRSIDNELMADFKRFKGGMDSRLKGITPQEAAGGGKAAKHG
jgi:murein DD-endopeptidase MepM/ murein hydrolase activator NlpD